MRTVIFGEYTVSDLLLLVHEVILFMMGVAVFFFLFCETLPVLGAVAGMLKGPVS